MWNKEGRMKIPVLFICAVAYLAVTGFFFDEPVLMNADKPFIELSGAVGTAVGNAGSAQAQNEKAEKPSEKADEASKASAPVSGDKGNAAAGKTDDKTRLEIIVRDESIVFENKTYADHSEFAKAVSISKPEGRVILVDDYAESETFKRTMNILKDLGIDYDEEQR